MLKYALPLCLLVASVLAEDFSYSCTDETLDSSDDALTASCDSGDGNGTDDTSSLDLNDCFAYADGEITVSSSQPPVVPFLDMAMSGRPCLPVDPTKTDNNERPGEP